MSEYEQSSAIESADASMDVCDRPGTVFVLAPVSKRGMVQAARTGRKKKKGG